MTKRLELRIQKNEFEWKAKLRQLAWGLCLYLLFFVAKYKTASLPDYLYFLFSSFGIVVCFFESIKTSIKVPIIFCAYLILSASISIYRDAINTSNTTLSVEVLLLLLLLIYLEKYSDHSFINLVTLILAFFIVDELSFEGKYLFILDNTLIGRAGNSSFLGESLVFSLPFFYSFKDKIRNSVFTILFSTSTCLILFIVYRTESRASLIGAIFFFLTIIPWKKINNKTVYFIKGLLLICAVIITIIIILYFKKNSSLGRLLIAKVSLLHSDSYFFIGLGSGSIKNNYLLFQEQYFASGESTQLEQLIADNVHFVYNDYLKNLMELGVLGILRTIVYHLFHSIVYQCFSPKFTTIG